MYCLLWKSSRLLCQSSGYLQLLSLLSILFLFSLMGCSESQEQSAHVDKFDDRQFPKALQEILAERKSQLDAEGGFSIAGRVTFADGREIHSGQDVQINFINGADKPLRIYDGGWFIMDQMRAVYAGAGYLTFRAFGYRALNYSVSPPQEQITYVKIRLEKLPTDQSGSVTGMVVDESGEPFTGATVTVCFPGASYGIYNTSRQVIATEADGRFAFGNLPPTKLDVVADAHGLTYDRRSITLKPGEQAAVELRLVPKDDERQ